MHPYVLSIVISSVRQISKLARYSCSAVCDATPLAIIVACLLWSGCHGKTTWSAEARSPDGQWLATARSRQWAGPGTAYDGTTVYLKWIKSSRPAAEVLSFSHEYGTMNLKMEWLTPTHLDIIYGPSPKPGDRVTVDFQVVKYGNVEISLRELSGETMGDTR